MISSSDRAKAILSGLNDGTFKFEDSSSTTAVNVDLISMAFASSEFLNNRAFAESSSIVQNIKNREVDSPGDDLKSMLELDYAATDDENSVISPAAYFYDLMRIVLSSIKIAADEKTSDKSGSVEEKNESNQQVSAKAGTACAKYSLLARRPDLLDIPLDKANTSTDLFPSLAIVNYPRNRS